MGIIFVKNYNRSSPKPSSSTGCVGVYLIGDGVFLAFTLNILSSSFSAHSISFLLVLSFWSLLQLLTLQHLPASATKMTLTA